ncbi:MAG TPA: hypothetical protein VK906_18030 [Egicoccus sp.]|nr:hypothetical protein [Egicoccus sp.]HSK25090.1 hypothetical protein [Egicoccus sp.]
MVQRLRGLGKTILLTTHYLDEAQHLADRVIVIAGGRLVWQGPPEQLIDHAGGRSVIRFRLPAGTDPADLPPVGEVAVVGDEVEVTATDPVAALHRLTAWALARDLELAGLALERRSLEEAYLDLLAEVGDGHV